MNVIDTTTNINNYYEVINSIPGITQIMDDAYGWKIPNLVFNGYGLTDFFIHLRKTPSSERAEFMITIQNKDLNNSWLGFLLREHCMNRCDNNSQFHMPINAVVEHYKKLCSNGIAAEAHFVNNDIAAHVEQDPFKYVDYNEMTIGNWWKMQLIRDYAKSLIK